MKKQNGFTLIELLVVLVILTALAGLVGPKVMGHLSSSNSKVAKVQLNDLSVAIDMFAIDNGRYPTTKEGLQSLISAPNAESTWAGPYLKGGKLPVDPWGKDYLYELTPSGQYILWSLGADGKIGGEGDNEDFTISS